MTFFMLNWVVDWVVFMEDRSTGVQDMYGVCE